MSRHDQRSTRLRHRPSRAVPALTAGILLLATGVALVWLSITRLVDGTWSTLLVGPRDWLAGLSWNDPAVWLIGIAAVVTGVILLLCAIIPGPFNALTISVSGTGAGDDEVQVQETVMTRRAVAHLAKARSVLIDGVGSASATATTGSVHVSVTTSLHDPGDLGIRITDAVRDRLAGTGLSPVPQVSATIRSKD